MVYAELVLVDNFAVDMLLCLMSGRLLGKKITRRAACAGAFGSVYALVCVINGVFTFIVFKILTLGVMSLICYGYKPMDVLKGGCAILSSVLLTGGCVFVFVYGFYGNLPARIVNTYIILPLILGVAMAVLMVEYIVRRREFPTAKTYILTAKLGDYNIVLNAYYDTGNRLVDLGGGGVVVADKCAVYAQTGYNEPCMNKRSFYINTVNGQSVLTGYYSDDITLFTEGSGFRTRGYIALGEVKGEYDAVIGSLALYK